jgi:hypothetical protein
LSCSGGQCGACTATCVTVGGSSCGPTPNPCGGAPLQCGPCTVPKNCVVSLGLGQCM